MQSIKHTLKTIFGQPSNHKTHKNSKQKKLKLDKQQLKKHTDISTSNNIKNGQNHQPHKVKSGLGNQTLDEQILIGFPNHLFTIDNWDATGINNIPTHFILYEHPVFYGHRATPGKLKYNKIRLIYVRAAILAYLDYLNKNITTKSGIKKPGGLVTVSFVSVDDCLKNNQALAKQIAKLSTGVKKTIKYWDPVDTELSLDVITKLIGNTSDIQSITKLDSPLFLTNEKALAEYHSKHSTGRFTHSAFYDWQKSRPEHKEFKFPGHSYDTQNRGQMPQNTTIPPLPKLTQPDIKYLEQANKYISAHTEWGDKTRPGAQNTITNIVFPISHQATKDWLQNFFIKKISHFGKYQDSIDGQARNYLFHSCISPMLNLGLITPYEVISAAHKYYTEHQSNVGVANYEGFIRQVIGWREYQRYIYLYAGDKMRKSNHFNNRGKLTQEWYSGQLGVRPVDDAIKMAFRDGYLHHILRLMVMGNFMNLVGLHPDEVYRWFMEFALDSYDWVMIGNVYSMALWADGGLSMRKPYISSDTYIMTLGTYTKESPQKQSKDSNSTSSEYESNNSTEYSSESYDTIDSKTTTHKSLKQNTLNGSIGWNRKWYVLFYDFINRCQTQLKSTYYAGLVKAWHNKSPTEKAEILKDAKQIKSLIIK